MELTKNIPVLLFISITVTAIALENWPCGNLGVTKGCKCGNTDITYDIYKAEKVRCCQTKECERLGTDVVCDNATVINWSEPCQSKCSFRANISISHVGTLCKARKVDFRFLLIWSIKHF